jgi:hypothetical protein
MLRREAGRGQRAASDGLILETEDTVGKAGRLGKTLRWAAVVACAILADVVLFVRVGVHDEWKLLGAGLVVGLYAWVILVGK